MTREDKLFHASVAAMQGLLSNDIYMKNNYKVCVESKTNIGNSVATSSVFYAKALLAELDKEGGE